MSGQTARVAGGGDVLVLDWFPETAPAGDLPVTGPSGAGRLVVDAEGLVGADNDALRLPPLAVPGWGREGIAYGPLERRPGRVLVVNVLNGHNASQTFDLPINLRDRLRRALRDAARLRFRRPRHHENMAVGWFASSAPTRPERGNGLVVHSASGDNGELWATVSGRPLRVADGVQNLEIVYAVVLREQGAAYYAASVPGARALGAYPAFRPLAIDTTDATAVLHPGLHQRILGEVGYRVDTRVNWVCVADAAALAPWYGTATIADRLVGSGALAGSAAERGGSWVGAGLERGPHGLRCARTDTPAEGSIVAPSPVGLLHVALRVGRRGGHAEVLWRAGPDGAWRCRLSAAGARLERRGRDGIWELVAADTAVRPAPGARHLLQVTDDGRTLGLHLDGRMLFGRWIHDERDATSTGVGVALAGPEASLADFEAHPRSVELPVEVDLAAPWDPTPGRVVLDERFGLARAQAAVDLDGLASSDGSRTWARTEGTGVIEVGASGGRVRADVAHPNPGRTLYTVPWDDPDYADLRLDMTPPGSARGQGHEGRCGIVLWQDPENYLVANVFIDNVFDGASISTFFRSRGHENMYDAVWTLVRGVEHGRPCTLRVVCDGRRFLAYLGAEPCLHRAFRDVYPDAPPLQIRRVGIVVNESGGTTRAPPSSGSWPGSDPAGARVREAALAALRCPLSGEPLELAVHANDGEDVTFGVLTSGAGSYPVVDGIPIVLPGQDRLVDLVRRGLHGRAVAAAAFDAVPHSRLRRLEGALDALIPGSRVARAAGRAREARERAAAERVLATGDPAAVLRHGYLEGLARAADAHDYFSYRYATPRHLVALGCIEALTAPGDRVLELGCGVGHMTWSVCLRADPGSVVGLDPVYFQLWAARRRLPPEVALVCGDATALPFADGTFDAVLAFDVLSFVEQKRALAREAARVLDPGRGRLAFTSAKNSLQPHAYAGLPVPPASWRALLDGLEGRLVPDRAVLYDYLARRSPALDADVPAEAIAAARTLTLVAAAGGRGLPGSAPLPMWPHARGPLALNPLYRGVAPTSGAATRLERRFPSRFFVDDNPEVLGYLPEVATVPPAARRALERGTWDPELEALVDDLVVLGLPAGYAVTLAA